LRLIPLFTRDELSAAFALVFTDRRVAERLAARWFVEIAADDVDANGYFSHPDWTDEPPPGRAAADGLVIAGPGEADESLAAAHQRYWGGWSNERKAEFLLRLSEFHLALVALVSPQLFERMRLARHMSPGAAARSRGHLTAVVRTLRG
jgi:hypothetical protein